MSDTPITPVDASPASAPAFSSPVILDDLPDGQLLDTAQAAQAIASNPQTMSVWRCTKRVVIPYTKIGRRVVYRAGDLKKFVRDRTVQA